MNKKKLVSGDAVLFLRYIIFPIEDAYDVLVQTSHTISIIGVRMEN